MVSPHPLLSAHTVADQGLPLVVALVGPSDAAFATERFAGFLLEQLEHRLVYTFDSDELFVYHQRPTALTLERSCVTEVALPGIAVHQVTDRAGSPFLLVHGPEPDLRWVGFTQAVSALVDELDVPTVWSVGAAAWLAPHTRPVSVWVMSRDMQVQARHATPTLDMHVSPASPPALLQAVSETTGVPTHLAVARVPQYLARYPYPDAPSALLSTVARECSLSLPNLPADTVLAAHLESQFASQPWFAHLLSALEENYDTEQDASASMDLPGDLIRQVEQYLADVADPSGDGSVP